MELFLEQLSNELIYVDHFLKDNTILINCHIKKQTNAKIRTYYYRKIKDMNYGTYKVILNIKCPVYYIDRKINNSSYIHKLDFVEPSSQMTKRLYHFIIDNMKESSAIGLERTIRKNIANISDSTILRKIKKKHSLPTGI